MQCRRCGEQNMPGLDDCFSCGLTLGEEAPTPIATTPRVRASNPLAKHAPARPPRAPWRPPVVLRRWLLLPQAALDALTPGLSAWRGGDRRLAAGLLGGALLSAALIALTWTSIHHGWSLLLLNGVMLTSAAAATRRRSGAPEPWDALIGAGFAIAGVALIWLVWWAGFEQWRPRVGIAGAPDLASGTYLVAPLEGPPSVNDLVVVQNRGRLRGMGDRLVAPVLAVPGQEVSRGGSGQHRALLVDGAATPVLPLDPDARLPPLDSPIAVPEGYVVLYAEPLVLTPTDELLGYLSYRWAPAELRGPVPWPPEAP